MIKVKTECDDCIHSKVCRHKGNVEMFYDKLKNENFGKGPNDDYDWVNIYKSRKNHKLDEWCEHPVTIEKINVQSVGLTRNGFGVAGTVEESKPDYFGFCDWIRTLPYSELITGKSLTDVPICNEIMEEAKKRNKEE